MRTPNNFPSSPNKINTTGLVLPWLPDLFLIVCPEIDFKVGCKLRNATPLLQEVISRVEGVTGDEGAVSTAAAGKVLQHRFEKQLDLLGEIVQGHIHLHQQVRELSFVST